MSFRTRLRDLKLGKKQAIGFAVILIIMAGANIFSIRKMASLKAELDEVSTNWLPRAIAISDININVARLRLNQQQHAFATDEETKEEQAVTMIELIDKINNNLDTYEELKADSETRGFYSEKEYRLYEEFVSKWDQYQELSINYFVLLREHKTREAVQLLNTGGHEIFNDLSTNLVELVSVNKTDAIAAAERADVTFNSTRVITIVLLVGTILLSIFFAAGLVRFITVPVQQLEKAAGKVAQGDLDIQLPVLSKDEIGNLAYSFNQMTNALRDANEKTQRQAHKLAAQNKQLQNAMKVLRDAQEQLVMQEKMAALGNLVAGVAHEINNPLGAVNSSNDVVARCVDRLKALVGKNGSTKKEEYQHVFAILKENIQVTKIAGDRIESIIKSLRNFSRLDEAEFQKVDIHDGIESSLNLLSSELRERIEVVKEYGVLPKIPCYPGQLNQVFLTLLKNATDAIENKGQVHIKTYDEKESVYIEITDSGRGIPENMLSKIFDFGFATSNARVKMRSGLSTAYSIIQKHKGEIKVKSKVGKGTTFSINLPNPSG